MTANKKGRYLAAFFVDLKKKLAASLIIHNSLSDLEAIQKSRGP